MPQTYGLSTRLRDHVDDLHDDFLAYTADSHICEREMRALRHKIAELTAQAAHLDDTVRLATTALKTGFQTDKVQRRVREQRELHDRPVCLVSYRTQKRRQDGSPSGAA